MTVTGGYCQDHFPNECEVCHGRTTPNSKTAIHWIHCRMAVTHADIGQIMGREALSKLASFHSAETCPFCRMEIRKGHIINRSYFTNGIICRSCQKSGFQSLSFVKKL